jgi:hypothetical protein
MNFKTRELRVLAEAAILVLTVLTLRLSAFAAEVETPEKRSQREIIVSDPDFKVLPPDPRHRALLRVVKREVTAAQEPPPLRGLYDFPGPDYRRQLTHAAQ